MFYILYIHIFAYYPASLNFALQVVLRCKIFNDSRLKNKTMWIIFTCKSSTMSNFKKR